jgi:uncharacterized cupin superfamily protein
MASPRIVDFRMPVESETTPVDPARILAGSPVVTMANRHADSANHFFVGVWCSTRGKWRIQYTEHEFCHLIEGRVRLIGDGGEQWEFGAGDAWVIPAGFSGTWETLEPARKHYAIYDPGA